MVERSQCFICKHLTEASAFKKTCKAFPNGIPEEIYFNDYDHKNPRHGDGGVRFEEGKNVLNQ